VAEHKFTAALNAATFPLVTRFQPRSVLMAQFDARLRDPASNPQNNTDNNPQNLPQVLYCENVLPTGEGCRSVGYSNVQAQFPGVGTPDDVIILRNDDDSWYYAPAQGMNYVTAALGTPWVSTNPLAGAPVIVDYKISVAYVNGQTFVCFGNSPSSIILQWDGAAFIDVTATFTGLTGAEIKAICGSGNYLIAIYSDASVKWSSLVDPLDFVASSTSGAGGQTPIDMRGTPLALTPVSGGFLIHCTENTVAAVYTQNSAQPWIFREVRNSGGLLSWRYLARETSAGVAYLFGTYGMQSLNLREAEAIHTNLTEFVSSKIIESFDTTTNLLSITRAAAIYVKVAFLGGRYLCVSYGTTDSKGPFSYILVYDANLRRWGKLKVDHYDIFQSAEAAPDLLSPFDSLFVLKTSGAVDQIILDDRIAADSGVLILGRYQLTRTQQIGLQELELEVLDSNEAPTVHVATSYNGTTVGEILPMVLHASSDNYRQYQKQIEGENLSFIIKGAFNLATVLISATKGARM
jgi:hypothetical protein